MIEKFVIAGSVGGSPGRATIFRRSGKHRFGLPRLYAPVFCYFAKIRVVLFCHYPRVMPFQSGFFTLLPGSAP